jgi:hypothetical protein
MPTITGVDTFIVTARERSTGEVAKALTTLPGTLAGWLKFHNQNSAILLHVKCFMMDPVVGSRPRIRRSFSRASLF